MKKQAWQKELKFDPIPFLLGTNNESIIYFTKRDLLGEKVKSITSLWQLDRAQKIIKKQLPDGSWKYPNPKERIRKAGHYNLYETFRILGFLIEYFGFNKNHEAIKKAKDFVFKHQSVEGDIRGIYWNQYSPNYTAGFFELFIKAGFLKDQKILKGLKWLLSVRQNDGGWVIPMRTRSNRLSDNMSYKLRSLEPDKNKPFSYMVTGVVLRAFANHPKYRSDKRIIRAGKLVLSKLFRRDSYPDRNTVSHWTKFTFPYNYTDLIAVFDPLAKMGFRSDHPKIKEGLDWFRRNQRKNGSWRLHSLTGNKKYADYWMTLQTSRIFKAFYK